MINFIFNQILFFLSIAIILFLPGWSLLLAIFGKSKILSNLEKFIFSFGFGLISVDFIFFLYSKLNWSITRLFSFFGIAVFILICLGIYKLRVAKQTKFNSHSERSEESRNLNPEILRYAQDDSFKLFNFSKKQKTLILLLIFLIFLIKTAYLSGSILPTATDMGHHMYWSKLMAETGQLPTYEGMPDFIIGEHIVFGLIAIWGNFDFFGAFPVVLLYLFNLLGILAVFVLTLRIFKNLSTEGGKNVAILSLLFLGVLYAVSSPQGKFVSGGVIGNTMGNFLLPMTFYFYYRAFEFLGVSEKKDGILHFAQDDKYRKSFLALAIFVTFGLFYTHHLTAFIFLFIVPLVVLIYLAVNYDSAQEIAKKAGKLIFSPQVLGTFAIGMIFFFFIFTPNYVKGSAVGTAVGTASKATRIGLSLDNLESSIGAIRLGLGFVGILLLALSWKRKNFGYALISGWMLMILLMSIKPNLLFIDLPSNRIGSYLSYPIAILCAYAFYFIFSLSRENWIFSKIKKNIFPEVFLKAIFLIILGGVLFFGISDSIGFFKNSNRDSALFETFDSSRYLAQNIGEEDVILKDHNYIEADAWMKLFFMRGYKYPLSRGFFKRYEDMNVSRETCTLVMISSPATPEAEKCFSETKTNFIMVNPLYDSAQFKKLNNFDEVYSSDGIAVFYKK